MNTPSLSEINKISNMNPNLITKHYKLKLMNDFMNILRPQNEIEIFLI